MVIRAFQFIIFALVIVLFNLFNASYFTGLKSGFYQEVFAQIPGKAPIMPPPPGKAFPPGKGLPPGKVFPPGPGKSPLSGQMPQKLSPSTKSGTMKMGRQNFANAYPEDITNENFPDIVESFDFKNANIRVVTEAISKLTGRNFIIDSGVNGTVTIIAPSRITVAEAYRAFLSSLAVNNLTVVPAGKFLKVTTLVKAKGSSEVFTGAYTPDTDQVITRIIQLKHSNVADVTQFLTKAVSLQGNVQSYEPTNTLVVTDFGSKVNNFMKIIQQIDESSVNEQMAVIPIRFAKAKDIADLLEKIINKGQPPPRGGRPNVPRFRRQKAQDKKKGSAFSLVLPDERTNSIIVLANQQGIAEVRRLIRQLDFDINPEDAGGLHVYYVKHAKAEDIASTISGIAQQSRKSAKGRPTIPSKTNIPSSIPSGASGLLGEDVQVTADEQTNSLIIAASRQDYEIVLNLLSKIDIPRDQVFVEAIILEMSVQDELSYGFNLLNFAQGTKGLGRAGFVSPNLLDTITNIGATGLILGVGRGQDVGISLNPLAGNSSNVTVKSVMGFVRLLQKMTKVNVLSTPQILALDNAEATIEVGERVATAPSNQLSAPGNPILQSPTYEDATIKLTITPQISSDKETVRLNIDQQIKEVLAASEGTTQPNFTTRALKSDVVVQNGDTIVLGGLMRDIEQPEINKVPILGDIPILGWLFKSKSRRIEKVNLLVFLTPRVIQSRADARALSDLKLKERLQFIKDTGGEDFHGRKVEEIRIANARDNIATEDLSEEVIEDLQEGLPETEVDDGDSIEEGIEDLEDIEL